VPLSQIRVICDYMGGGFGSKGGAGKYSIIAALFAKQLGRPVRCVLTRHEENLAAGNRSATLQKIKIAAKDGRITAIDHTSWSNAGQGRWVANPTGPTNTLYDFANLTTKSYRVVTNAGSLSAFRAPGYVEGTFALESAIDELAERVGVDPLTLRRRHAASQTDPRTTKTYSLKRLLECYSIGAREIGWSKRRAGGTRGSAPHRRRGIGMGTQTWGAGGAARRAGRARAVPRRGGRGARGAEDRATHGARSHREQGRAHADLRGEQEAREQHRDRQGLALAEPREPRDQDLRRALRAGRGRHAHRGDLRREGRRGARHR